MDSQRFSPSTHTHPPYTVPSIVHMKSHVCVLLFCYFAGVFQLNFLLILPAVLLLLVNWRSSCVTLYWTIELQAERFLQRQLVIKDGESVNWINQIISKWWTCCSDTVTKFVKDWVEPIVEKFKFPIVVDSIKISSFDSGPYRMKFSNLHLIQPVKKKGTTSSEESNHFKDETKNKLNVFTHMTLERLLKPPISMEAVGSSIFAFEVDADFDVPKAEFKMKARVGSKSVHHDLVLNIESFHVAGRLRCVFCADKKADFPHITTGDLCFVENPIITVQCSILRDIVDVSNTPGLKQIMEKYIAYGFKRLLVYPGRQHIDFTPTPLPGLEWAELRRFGLSEGVVTVKIVCENMEAAAKKAMMQNYYCKLRFGSQKCIRECANGTISSWSSTFSFLVHNPATENLLVKLKNRRVVLRNYSVAKREINLLKLGIIEQNGTETGKSQVGMSSDDGSLQLVLYLFYSPLPQFSLLQYTPALDNCDTSEAGVLYIHVHAARNLIGHTATNRYDPYCIVKQGEKTVFKTHTLVGTRDPVWEKGMEILVPWCSNTQLSFDVFHNSHGLAGSHDLLGSAHLHLHAEQSQILQHKLQLSNTMKRTTTTPNTTQSLLYISVIFRNVESVNWTRESLQETFLERTHKQSDASCLDTATQFLNPTNKGFQSSNVQMEHYDTSSDDNDNVTSGSNVS